MLDKEKIEELYKNGYKAVEIAEILGEKQENIRQCIHRNFKHHKIEHWTNRERDKEILRVTMRETKNFMSDADFIKRNRSIYRTKENGDIEKGEVKVAGSQKGKVEAAKEYIIQITQKDLKTRGGKKEVKNILPFDAPRRLTNENKCII